MSEEQELQLSIDMVRDIQARLKENDERAADPGVSAQYLAAVIGFLLGQVKAETGDKKEFLRQLTDFAAGVIDDVEAQEEMKGAQPGGGTPIQVEEEQPVSGVWTPDQK